jgi:hypothetical protein
MIAMPVLAKTQTLWQAVLAVVGERSGKAVRIPAKSGMLGRRIDAGPGTGVLDSGGAGPDRRDGRSAARRWDGSYLRLSAGLISGTTSS